MQLKWDVIEMNYVQHYILTAPHIYIYTQVQKGAWLTMAPNCWRIKKTGVKIQIVKRQI